MIIFQYLSTKNRRLLEMRKFCAKQFVVNPTQIFGNLPFFVNFCSGK